MNSAVDIVNSSIDEINEINEIIRAGDYPRLDQREIGQINLWLRRKFTAGFCCENRKEASRLIKTISAWTRQHQADLQTFIDSEIWQCQPMDALTFQRQVLAEAFERTPRRRTARTIKKMLREMLRLFCSPQPFPTESAFEKNKLRNFIASSRLEGIHLKDN
jgi:hypothetical protein